MAVLKRTTKIRGPRNIVGYNIVGIIFWDIKAILKPNKWAITYQGGSKKSRPSIFAICLNYSTTHYSGSLQNRRGTEYLGSYFQDCSIMYQAHLSTFQKNFKIATVFYCSSIIGLTAVKHASSIPNTVLVIIPLLAPYHKVFLNQ